jgi:hypothetical protein
MTTDPEPSSTSRPAWHWAIVAVVGLGVLVAAVSAGLRIAPLIRGDHPAEPASSAAPAAPAPAPAAVQPAAEPAATAPATVEASREGRPRPKKKEPVPAKPAEPAAPTTGELQIESDVPGAMVFLDRKYLGNTPVTAKDVPPGSHRLNLTADGYDGYSEPIEVAAGPATVTVRFKEVRLREQIDVVHKHAMGSCEGRLLADPQGIRYETTNKDDGFALKYSEVEVFEIDYLKKNLRIKKRGGKQYNFTTKADNADPLFVFHKNVDKVRKQVAGQAASTR